MDLAVSFIAAALLLALAAHTIYRGRTVPGFALSASVLLLALIEALDQAALHLGVYTYEIKWASVLLESFLPASLLLFSVTYSRTYSARSIPLYCHILLVLSFLFPAAVLFFPLGDFFYAPDLQTERMLFLGDAGYWFYMLIMLYIIVALMNLESTFSATAGPDRWRMKFEVIGLAGMLAVLIFYFSQGLLYRTINMNMLPVKSGVFIIAAVAVGYSRLTRGNGVKVAVSRYVIYRSLTLLLIGAYLLILGIVGEGMKYFGASFGRNAAIFIAFASGILLLAVLFSEQLRRKAKVSIDKHFFAQKHDYRTQWITFTERLAVCRTSTEIYDEILTTYMRSFGLRGASLYLCSAERLSYTLAACREMRAGPEMPASEGLKSYFLERGRVLDPDGGEYALAKEESDFFDLSGTRLLVPVEGNGRIEAFVAFGEQLASEVFTYEDYDLMKTLAKQAALSIINFRLSEELAETREIAAVAKISSFVIHDLKNLASSLSLLLDNAEEYIGDPEFQNDMIDATRNTLSKMKGLIQKLKMIPEKQSLNAVSSDMLILARETVSEFMRSRPGAAISCGGVRASTMVDQEEFKKVLLNLILNAVESVGRDGAINIETRSEAGKASISVKDNGCGMTTEFMTEHLFKPFRTTKSKGLGIGLYQCKQIIEAHGGTITVASAPGQGTTFTITLASSAMGTNGKTVNY